MERETGIANVSEVALGKLRFYECIEFMIDWKIAKPLCFMAFDSLPDPEKSSTKKRREFEMHGDTVSPSA